MQDMATKIINSDTIVPYLVTTNSCNNIVQVTIIHSITRYSARGLAIAMCNMACCTLLEGTVGTQLPLLVKVMMDPTEDFIHVLALEAMMVPLDLQVVTYFEGPAALNLMPSTTSTHYVIVTWLGHFFERICQLMT